MSKSRRTRLTKRDEQSEQTRHLLLAVSLDLFVRKGYTGTTIRDIAKHAKVSPGLVLHYFASKQAILYEHAVSVKYGVDSVGELLNSSNQPLETFAAIATMILESFREDYSRRLFLLANQIMSFDSIPDEVKSMVSPTQSIELSIPLIKLGQAKLEIKQGDPTALAVAFWGTLQGIAEILLWNPEAVIPDVDQVICILKA